MSDIEMFADQWRYFQFAVAEFFKLIIKSFIFFIKEMADVFHNGHGIVLLTWMLTEIDKRIEKLFDIGHVEIACQYQVARHPVVLSQKRMDGFNRVAAKRAITKV